MLKFMLLLNSSHDAWACLLRGAPKFLNLGIPNSFILLFNWFTISEMIGKSAFFISIEILSAIFVWIKSIACCGVVNETNSDWGFVTLSRFFIWIGVAIVDFNFNRSFTFPSWVKLSLYQKADCNPSLFSMTKSFAPWGMSVITCSFGTVSFSRKSAKFSGFMVIGVAKQIQKGWKPVNLNVFGYLPTIASHILHGPRLLAERCISIPNMKSCLLQRS